MFFFYIHYYFNIDITDQKCPKQIAFSFFFWSLQLAFRLFYCHILYVDAFVNMHLSWTLTFAYKYVYMFVRGV